MIKNSLQNVTFAIPTYNRNSYLRRLLDSISVEFGAKVAISDNGGFVTNETIDRHKDHLVIAKSEDIIEMYENWNLVISLVETEYFFIPSDDDIYYSEKFEIVAGKIKQYPDADIIIFGHDVIDEFDKHLSSWMPSEERYFNAPDGFDIFKYGVEARFPAILFKTSLVNKIGKIDPTYKFTAGDSLLIQKCLIHGKSVFVQEKIGAYRTWPNNFTSQLIASKEWLEKIDRWQDELALEVGKVGIKNFHKESVKDEVYAKNLIVSINVKRKAEGIIGALKFFILNRFPFHASRRRKLSIIKSILFR